MLLRRLSVSHMRRRKDRVVLFRSSLRVDGLSGCGYDAWFAGAMHRLESDDRCGRVMGAIGTAREAHAAWVGSGIHASEQA